MSPSAPDARADDRSPGGDPHGGDRPGGERGERHGGGRHGRTPTGLADGDQPDFDASGFDEEPRPGPPRVVPEAPVRRLLSLAMAGLSLLLTAAMVVGGQLTHTSFALVVLGVQVLFVVVWTVASRPPGAGVVVAVGVVVAIVADVTSVLVSPATLEPLAYLTAGGFVAAVVGQLLRRAGRIRVTESLGSSLVVVLGVVAYTTLIVLSRNPLGSQVISACFIGAGVALMVAHLADTVLPVPRVAPAVARGGLGVVLGAMAGTAASGVAGSYLEGLETLPTAAAGLTAALIALMVDLSANYAEASRRIAGVAPDSWLVRHLQGPLTALVLAAPTAYAASLILARGL